jgi:hypothetical protein
MANEKDLIDLLIDALNDGVPGITFDRDVLDTNRPDDWAAVELTGSEDEWADGRMVDQVLRCDIWVCLSDRGSAILDEVQTVLRQFNEDHMISWSFPQRNYLYDLDKVIWKWQVRLWGTAGFWVNTEGGGG